MKRSPVFHEQFDQNGEKIYIVDEIIDVDKELTIEDREWICPICNNSIQRDVNAAMNLKDLGLKFLAEGSSVNADESRNGNHL